MTEAPSWLIVSPNGRRLPAVARAGGSFGQRASSGSARSRNEGRTLMKGALDARGSFTDCRKGRSVGSSFSQVGPSVDYPDIGSSPGPQLRSFLDRRGIPHDEVPNCQWLCPFEHRAPGPRGPTSDRRLSASASDHGPPPGRAPVLARPCLGRHLNCVPRGPEGRGVREVELAHLIDAHPRVDGGGEHVDPL